MALQGNYVGLCGLCERVLNTVIYHCIKGLRNCLEYGNLCFIMALNVCNHYYIFPFKASVPVFPIQ